MSVLVDVLSWILLIGGALAALTASVGILRLPDFFCRTHSAGIMDTLGAGLILLGLGLQVGIGLIFVKLALVFGVILLTGPTAAHALARSALHAGVRPRTDDDSA